MSINTLGTKASQSVSSTPNANSALKPNGKDEGFKSALELQFRDAKAAEITSPKAALPKTLEFSNHAVERMTQRGISFTPDQMTKIEDAARKASEKGAKEALIFSDDSALIVSLKNNKIVTVMDKASMKDNVFTNIDSTVIL